MPQYGIPHAIATLLGVAALSYQTALVVAARDNTLDIAGVVLATCAVAVLPALGHAAWHRHKATAAALFASTILLIVWVTPQGIARVAEPQELQRQQAKAEASDETARRTAQDRARAAFESASADMARACADGPGPRCKGAKEVLAERRETLRDASQPVRAATIAPVLPVEHAASLLIGLDLAIWACFFFALAPFSAARPTAITEREEPVTEAEIEDLKRLYRPKSKLEAERDIVTLIGMGRPIGSQDALALRWGVSKGTVSKWLMDWERRGLLRRASRGTRKTVARL